MKDKRLTCAHCGTTFIGTDSQYKKRHERPSYCSRLCGQAASDNKKAATAIKRGSPLYVPIGPCPTCGKMFNSHAPKIFCSQKCYQASPQFQEMMIENSKKGLIKQDLKWREKMTHECEFCKKEFRARRKKTRFCSHLCYRKHRAALFDAWIANPQEIALPQGYDEYMTQELLPCLIKGCGWEGHGLASHLQTCHGIKASEYKRAAGFNLSTGLVSPSLSEKLSNRDSLYEHLRTPEMRQTCKDRMGTNTSAPKDGYVSIERKEHASKTRAILEYEKGAQRTCKGCGKEFTQKSYFGRATYCSVKCRSEFYKREKEKKRKVEFKVCICARCKKEFKTGGTLGRARKYCSAQCRNNKKKVSP